MNDEWFGWETTFSSFFFLSSLLLNIIALTENDNSNTVPGTNKILQEAEKALHHTTLHYTTTKRWEIITLLSKTKVLMLRQVKLG